MMSDAPATTPSLPRADSHPVQILYAKVDGFSPYPPGVIRMCTHINRTGFFPGSPGLWNVTADTPWPRWPLNGVMIVGHNYDCEASFCRSLHQPGSPEIESHWPAFRWLRRLLKDATIQLEDCFFTNFFVGLKAGADPTGLFPGGDDAGYVAHCRALLLDEIRLQQPTLLLTLGQAVLPFLAQLEPLGIWSGSRSLRKLDELHTALLPSAQFADCPHPTTVVALTHPTFWPPNVARRRFISSHNGLLSGAEAEHELLRDGVHCSGYIATPADEHRR